jgi:tRNA-(ms[2]io[6]A)-hydroxylase
MDLSPLCAPTPPGWVAEAARRWPELLADHANCEKKAASTALALMFAYPEDRELAARLSRLAREELRHFEQVDKLMQQQGVPYLRRKPGRYASRLRSAVSNHEPERKLDLLLSFALIEARSCERFRLPPQVASLYSALEVSEARHHQLYLRLAEKHAQAAGLVIAPRLAELARVEAEAATAPDAEFRFHSGEPVADEPVAGAPVLPESDLAPREP